MSTPSTRARVLRAGLVGTCAALVTALAHAMGGGGHPSGSALVVLVLGCATIGAGVGAMDVEERRARVGLVIGALCASQALGHLLLTAVGGHHHAAASYVNPVQMLALHATAAVALGLLIGTVEYLYPMCASLLTWLRLFATAGIAPAVMSARPYPNLVVFQSVLRRAGLGTRAPPGLVVPGA